ncbi:hypothetical protein [Phycicoccus sp.]|uniref:hypothetical protein n=1 Tax=Phycicoccus sp. TaxID=1902410 RepID=UPI002C43F433|nr:hypothetical protein [Phycicoccus sp.]HMM96720.1 hypothetical protein [Phycicoccus sp.]
MTEALDPARVDAALAEIIDAVDQRRPYDLSWATDAEARAAWSLYVVDADLATDEARRAAEWLAPGGDDFESLIRDLAATDLLHRAAVARGEVSVVEAKVYEARMVEVLQHLDRLQGVGPDATYSQFRRAFEQGLGCRALFEIRNRMSPKDPLREAANEDLRSAGCYSPTSRRSD